MPSRPIIAYAPHGSPVHNLDELPSIGLPGYINVGDDVLVVDGWRFPYELLTPEVCAWLIISMTRWRRQPEARKWVEDLSDLIIERMSP